MGQEKSCPFFCLSFKIYSMKKFTKLNSEPIVQQMEVLSKRIEERFPDSGLNAIGKESYKLAQGIKEKHNEFSKPNYFIRVPSYLLIFLIIVGVAYTIYRIELPGEQLKLFELFSIVESGINDLVFISIAIYFLFGIETRIKRKKALRAMEELRSFVHVIDMHQLSKEPQTLPFGESIIWALAKEQGHKSLRYPAEDGRYEEDRMDQLGL
jgi:hypothetical protein